MNSGRKAGPTDLSLIEEHDTNIKTTCLSQQSGT